MDRVQNLALRTITGAAKSTPIAAMKPQTNTEPLDVHPEKAALTFWECNKRVYTNYWNGYKQAGNRLQNQQTPLALANLTFT
jgi:hypothetical protein